MLMRFDPFRDLDRVAQFFAQQGGLNTTNTIPMDPYRDGDQATITVSSSAVKVET